MVDLGSTLDFELYYSELGWEVDSFWWGCKITSHNLQKRMALNEGFDGLTDQFMDLQCS